MNLSEFNALSNSATNDVSLMVKPAIDGVYPYMDIMSRVSSFSTARAIEVTNPSNNSKHLVMIAYRVVDGEEDIGIWCGDRFAEEGKLSSADAATRATEACQGLPDATTLASSMVATFHGVCPACSGCNFWAKWRGKRELCKHTSSVLARLHVQDPNFLDKLRSSYATVVTPTSTSSAAAAAIAGYGLAALAFRVPVLIEGDRGSGKTTEARALARSNNYYYVEAAGHAGVEAMDLLGHLVPVGYQQMVWKDGPVAEAFRNAAKEKVVLVLDELLRVPDRELSLLLTALSPFEGKYTLRTGRVVRVEDGIGVEEVLQCPVGNLCVVATTNVGAEYQVDDIDPALAERFVVLRKDTTEASLRAVLTAVAASTAMPRKVVDSLVTFYVKMTAAKNSGLIRYAPTTRTMVRALELSSTPAQIPDAVDAMKLLWVARDAEGIPVPAQVNAVTNLIKMCLRK